MSMLNAAAAIAQVITAVTAVVGVFFVSVEYRKSLKRIRVDLAIEATKSWDSAIDDYTSAAFSLICNHRDDATVLRAIKESQALSLEMESHKGEAYGFLIESNGEISAKMVNRLRRSIVNILNSWEFISLLYESNRADRTILDAFFERHLKKDGTVAQLGPFMDLFGEHSWETLRSLVSE